MLHSLNSTLPTSPARWLLRLWWLATLLLLSGASAWAADQAPTRKIFGNNTGLSGPHGVAELADGSLAVSSSIDGSVRVYAADANGNATPTHTIKGPSTGLDWPYGLATLADGSLAVTNTFVKSVTVYAANANGDVAPTRTISGGNTGLNHPYGLATLADGSLAVNNCEADSVTVFAADANGDATPTRTIKGGRTGIDCPGGLAELADGSLAVTNINSASVTVFAADANGDAAPTRMITGMSTGLVMPYGVAELADGSLAVTNRDPSTNTYSVMVYSASANGNATPTRTISGGSTGLNLPVGLATLADNSLAVVNYAGVSVTVYASPPSPPAAPTVQSASVGNGLADMAFTAPTNNGGASITNYEYSTDDGATWTARSPAATSSPVTITGLTNGTTYRIKLRAVNSVGAGMASAAVAVTPPANVDISWVTVGNPGNAADTTGYGAVSAAFKIMRFEWTNAQYVAFLNAIDPDGSNPNGVYHSNMGANARGGISYTAGAATGSKYATKTNMGDKPVNYISWFDAARVANWLHHGAQNYARTDASASAPQNTGAYTLGTATSGTAPVRNADARYWIPTENEWYKAAYYSGSGTTYRLYGNGNSATPTAVSANASGDGSAGGSGNFANYNRGADWNGQDGNVTTVGTNGAASDYDAFDLSGNLWEWNDLDGTANTQRGLRGGSFPDSAQTLAATNRVPIVATLDGDNNGFRLATTPAAAPDAPTNLAATPGDASAIIAFTAPASDGGAAITNYEYSTDNGATWTARNPAATTSPITITGLTNGTAYQVKLRAVNSAGAGAASAAVSVTPVNPCGPGIALTISPKPLWQQLALPCVPSATPPSVANVFGNFPTANLEATQYDVANSGWVMNRREVTTTPSSYVKLAINTDLDVGTGYWIKSLAAPVGGKLTVAGTATPTDVTQANGCAVAAGCKAISVTTVNGDNRYNLVGNPFPYAIDWSKVRVRVGSTIYSPCQAAGLGAGDGCSGPAPSPAATPVISNVINIWNGTTYVAFSDLAPTQGNLQYFKSFWVNVLPGGFNQAIDLLIPAEVSTLSQATPAVSDKPASAALPWYLAWLDWVAPPVAAQPAPARPAVSGHAHPQALPNAADWYVRLKLDNRVTGWEDHGNLLGQITGAQLGYDGRDLQKMAPFAKPYLTLVFPHPEWGPKAGDYATDFRPALAKPPQDWTFEVRADPVGSVVFLSWEGDANILKRSRLVDLQTGKTIQPAAGKWAKKGYPITLTNPVQRYVWRYLGK